MKFLLLIYLIGFAKGASGQPDEPLGSINPQASIQPRPGEHFSLINPSDAEALYATVSSEQSSNDYSSEHSSSENSSSEQAPDDQPLDEEPFGENPSGENAVGEKIQREQLSSEKPLDEKVASGKISNEQSPGEKPSVEQVSSEKSSAEKVSSEQSSVEQPSGKKIVSGKSQSEQSSGDSSSGEQPSREPSSGTLSTASSSGAGINCHTCLFMNEQGRCLRGEGVCTTQNSQQCMLKKIFEGGRLQFMVQGCENMCPSMNLFSHGTRMQIICCRNRSLCNKV